ncbi:MAG TPA: ATP-dependent Clp protease proteolytic subunit [Dehalococcoidia bacterium]|jgi:ATP-dependent Clp protease protease subunit
MPYVPNPAVIESDGRVERSMDVYSRLLRDRIVYLGTPVDDSVANLIIAQLLYLSSADPDRDIHLYINSPGGVVSAGLGIYDTMQHIKCDVSTICVGLSASMGAMLLAAGAKGKRYILPNAEVMIHQGSAGFGGATPDIEIQAQHLLRTIKRLNGILAQHTGQPIERVTADTNRDFWMTAEQAIDYGIVDSILTPVQDLAAAGASR